MIPENCREAALAYAALGWRVLPLQPNSKLPRIKDWTNNATTSAETIEDWWRVWPDSNIGIATGKDSGLAVLDVDRKNGVDGETALDALTEKCGALPDTLQVFTPSGGYHLYFKHPGNGAIKNSAGKLGKGLDTRADGGYVVAPPSVLDGKPYEWEASSEPDENPPAPAPQHFFTPRGVSLTHAAGGEKGGYIEGHRNAQLTALGGALRRIGLGVEAIAEALLVTNGQRCEPPLNVDEVRQIAESVGRYRADGDVQTFPLTHVANVKRGAQAIPWAIEGVLEKGGHTCLFGEPEAFKTFIAFSMGGCLAAGLDWYGRAVEQCGVVYLVGEGYPGIAQRIKAWETHFGVSLDETPFYLSEVPAELTVEENVAALADAVSQIDNPGFIVIDTLARNFGPASENSTEDMRRYVALIDKYLRNPFGASILHVHHPGLTDNSRGRGSSVLRGALEAELRAERCGMRVYLSCTKMKNAPHPPSMAFHARTVAIADDVTSLALEFRGEEDAQPIGAVTGRNQVVALDALRSLCREDHPRASISEWKEVCKKGGLSAKRFPEVASGLEKKGRIRMEGPMVFLPEAAE